MNGIENYIEFIIYAIVMNLTPGADTIYITKSIAQGKKSGVYSVLGIGTGALVHIAIATFGLSIILMKSILLFTIIKWAGTTYLIYLGIKMFIDKAYLFNNEDISFEKVNLLKIYHQGLFTNLLNPKVAVFFISLLPQFITPEYVNNAPPFLILGGPFLLTGTI